MKNGTLLVIMLVGFMLQNCHKSKINNYPLNGALVGAFNYKPGTYWIYRDSISGIQDSFFVTANTSGNEVYSNNLFSFDWINVAISECTISPTQTVAKPNWNFIYVSNVINLTYVEGKIYTGTIEYSPLINYPFQDTVSLAPAGVYTSAYRDSGLQTVNNIFSTYTLNGQVFTNVAVVNDTANLYLNGYLAPYNYNDWFYICPAAGIIKMRLNHPQDSLVRVWELQRWNIVK